MLGRYKLVERIGEGGCGVVYVVDQTDRVRRRVALKLIKLGMDTKQVVAWFEAGVAGADRGKHWGPISCGNEAARSGSAVPGQRQPLPEPDALGRPRRSVLTLCPALDQPLFDQRLPQLVR